MDERKLSPEFLNEFQAADLIGVSVSTIRRDRQQDRRIPFTRYRGRILYSAERIRQTLLELQEGGQPRRRKQRAGSA